MLVACRDRKERWEQWLLIHSCARPEGLVSDMFRFHKPGEQRHMRAALWCPWGSHTGGTQISPL